MRVKVYDGHNEEGDLVYIEVANSLLSRRAAIKVIKEIPNAEVVNEDLKDDVFCTFKLGDKVFEIMEPWGDNSRYHIGEKEEVQSSNELQVIKQKFSAHKPGVLAILGR